MIQELKILREKLPALVKQLRLDMDEELLAWTSQVDKKLLPKLSPDFPLVASICGGGSSGKSTLFNALIGENRSPTGGTAGINRRILIAGNSDRFSEIDDFANLFQTFGFKPEPLIDPNSLLQPGKAMCLLNKQIPQNIVLLDTPDFDTGLQGTYTNREIARQALEVSDIIIYIFTNANYNNRDNTDFIKNILTGIGIRKCFLVYRVYAGYKDQEILEHAQTVAENLYGSEADQHILGVYRADEDNRVAADQTMMYPRPMWQASKELDKELDTLDRISIRLDMMSSIIKDALDYAVKFSDRIRMSQYELELYQNALQTWESHCVREAIKRFPMDVVLKRFLEIWQQTDPAHIKWMRKAGRILDLPIRAAASTVRWFKGRSDHHQSGESQADESPSAEAKGDLLVAANHLWRKFIDPELTVKLASSEPVAEEMYRCFQKIETMGSQTGQEFNHKMQRSIRDESIFTVYAHPALRDTVSKLDSEAWQTSIDSILSDTEKLLDTSGEIDHDLKTLVAEYRKNMNLISKMGQTFSAFLNVLSATVAVTYILSTGDPIGATGIKVKLTGLFGLKDLYALVAFPATSGLRKADEKQLRILMGPIAESWLKHKLEMIQAIFQNTISGETLAWAEQVQTDIERDLEEVDRVISTLKKQSLTVP